MARFRRKNLSAMYKRSLRDFLGLGDKLLKPTDQLLYPLWLSEGYMFHYFVCFNHFLLAFFGLLGVVLLKWLIVSNRFWKASNFLEVDNSIRIIVIALLKELTGLHVPEFLKLMEEFSHRHML